MRIALMFVSGCSLIISRRINSTALYGGNCIDQSTGSKRQAVWHIPDAAPAQLHLPAVPRSYLPAVADGVLERWAVDEHT